MKYVAIENKVYKLTEKEYKLFISLISDDETRDDILTKLEAIKKPILYLENSYNY